MSLPLVRWLQLTLPHVPHCSGSWGLKWAKRMQDLSLHNAGVLLVHNRVAGWNTFIYNVILLPYQRAISLTANSEVSSFFIWCFGGIWESERLTSHFDTFFNGGKRLCLAPGCQWKQCFARVPCGLPFLQPSLFVRNMGPPYRCPTLPWISEDLPGLEGLNYTVVTLLRWVTWQRRLQRHPCDLFYRVFSIGSNHRMGVIDQ